VKNKISPKQYQLLEAICDAASFDEQATAANDLWPNKFKHIRRSFSRLNNLGFIEWLSDNETIYEARWAITTEGVRYLIAKFGKPNLEAP
jgi:hypothetical protein